MLEKQSKWLKGFTKAVAFDRQDDFEIIITQGGTPCASEAFAKDLAESLEKADPTLQYEPSTKGVFTDVKLYAGLIPECVNMAVGYANQHTRAEYLDVGHLERLKDACIKIDWEKLSVSRKIPPAQEPFRPSTSTFSGRDYDSFSGTSTAQDYYKALEKRGAPNSTKPGSSASTKREGFLELLLAMGSDEVAIFAEEDPDNTAKAIKILIAYAEGLKQRIATLEELL